jgi:hypothetical protein
MNVENAREAHDFQTSMSGVLDSILVQVTFFFQGWQEVFSTFFRRVGYALMGQAVRDVTWNEEMSPLCPTSTKRLPRYHRSRRAENPWRTRSSFLHSGPGPGFNRSRVRQGVFSLSQRH